MSSQEPTIPFPRESHPIRRSSMPAAFHHPHPSRPTPMALSSQQRSQSTSQQQQPQTSDSRLHYFLSMLESSAAGCHAHPNARKTPAAPLRVEDAVDLGDDDALSSSPVLTGSSWGSSGWFGDRKAATQPPTPLPTPPSSRRPSILASLASRPSVGDLSMTPAMERIDSRGNRKHYNPSRDPRLLGI